MGKKKPAPAISRPMDAFVTTASKDIVKEAPDEANLQQTDETSLNSNAGDDMARANMADPQMPTPSNYAIAAQQPSRS